MSFDAGTALAHWNLDSSGYEKGAGKMNSANSGISKSMFSAQLAYDVFKQAVQQTIKTVGECINKFIEQEKQEKQLETVLKSTGYAAGLTATEIENMASSLQGATTFGDEAILSGQNLLLTFTNIGKDVFPMATETMLDMSQALGQDLKSSAIQLGKTLNDPNGMAAMKRVGVSFTDAQIAMGKELFETGKVAEYQKLVLEELNKEFGGSAKAARDTFGGSLKALNNSIGDVQEQIGRYITTAGKPFVDMMGKTTQAVDDFLKSEEGMKKIADILGPIAGGFSVAWSAATNLWGVLEKFAGETSQSVSNGLTTIAGKGGEANIVFSLLGGAVNTVSAGFTIAGKIINFVIQTVADLISAIGNSINVLGKWGEALIDPFNPDKWGAVDKAIKDRENSFKNLGKNFATNFSDIIDTTVKEFSKFGTNSKKIGDELKKTYDDTVQSVNSSLDKLNNKYSNTTEEIKTDNKELVEIIENDSEILTETIEENAEKQKQAYISVAETILSYTTDTLEAIGTALATGGDIWKSVAEAAKESIAKILEALGQQAAIEAAIALIPGPTFNPVSAALWGAASAAAFVAAGAVRALAEGGKVDVKEPVLVGEEGPELFVPKNSGNVYTNSETNNLLKNRVSNNYNMTINTDKNLTGLEKTNLIMLHRLRSNMA